MWTKFTNWILFRYIHQINNKIKLLIVVQMISLYEKIITVIQNILNENLNEGN